MAIPDLSAEDDDGYGFDLTPLLSVSPEAEATVREMVDNMRRPIGPGDSRRHHYVPQCYLRRFAHGDRIARVRLAKPQRHEVTNVLNVAVMKDLYTTIDAEVGETVAIERLFAVIDGIAAKALPRLADGVLFPPRRADRVDLAVWLSLLRHRSPHIRRQMEAIADQTFKLQMSLIRDEDQARAHLREMHGAEPDEDSVRDLLDLVGDMDSWEVAPHQNEMIGLMLDTGLKATPFLLGRHWTVMKFSEPGLVLTDNPLVVFQARENWTPSRGVSIGNADEIWFPLDRSSALILHSDALVGERVVRNPATTIDEFNQVVVSQAAQEIYCHPDDLPRLCRLDLPKANRPIMKVSGADWITAKIDGVNAPLMRTGHHRYRRPS